MTTTPGESGGPQITAVSKDSRTRIEGGSNSKPAAVSARSTGFRLPFTIQLVVFFFLFDLVENLAHLVVAIEQAPLGGFTRNYLVDICLPPVLGILFDALLAVQIGLRTRAGRFWGIVYLISLTAVGIALLIEDPQRWLELGTVGRLREVATWTINVFLAACLFSPAARRTLVH